MKRWSDLWNSFWFPKTTTLRLSICRVVVVGAQLFLFFPSLGRAINLLKMGGQFIEPQILILGIATIVPGEVFFTPSTFSIIYWVTVVAGITCLIGLGTRTSAFIFALGNWIFIAHRYSYGEEHHAQAILCIFLILLAFSPSGECLSIDALIRRRRNDSENKNKRAWRISETAVWPLRLVQVLLGLAYFSTGLAKMLYGGIEWMNGYTLQQYLFRGAVVFENPLGIWLAQQHTLCLLMSIGTILFELLFFVTLIIPRTVPYFLVAGTLLHIGIFATMGAPFFQHIVLYSVFIDFERLFHTVRSAEGKKRMFRLKRPERRSAVIS